MFKLAEITHTAINDWIEEFRERLRGWATSVIKLGIEAFMDLLGRGLAKQSEGLLDSLIASEDMPEEVRSLFKSAKAGGGEWQALLLSSVAGAAIGGGVQTALFPPLEKAKQAMGKKIPYQLLPIINLMALKYRGLIDDTYFKEVMHRYGFADLEIDHMVKSFMFYPLPQDLILWLAREVFEPDMIDRYGLDDEAPLDKADLFLKAGVSEEQMLNYWRAHWEHASFGQVLEMLHRGLLTTEKGVPGEPNSKEGWAKRDEEGRKAMYEWYRVVEIPPYWRDRLTEMSWNVPTRVDVRRWWDMRTIDEQELYNIYHRMGYHGKDLDNYVLWTKVYTAYPNLLSRYGKGWITLDEVRAKLIEIGMPSDRVEEMLQESISPEGTGRVTNERDLTKTDIVKGVKEGIITRGEAIELLVDLGYSEDEGDYILAINIPRDEEDAVVKERELTKADILNGLKTGVLTDAEALAELQEIRYSPSNAQTILDIFKASITPPAEPRAKEASKADIVLAVKNGLITPESAYLMLQDIGYSPEASQFILAVRAETSPFSPVTPEEFKELTSKYRRAVGMEAKPVPEELKAAGAKLVAATQEVERLKAAVAAEAAKFVDESAASAETLKPLTDLRVALHRAEAELVRVQQDYDRLKAAFKFGG